MQGFKMKNLYRKFQCILLLTVVVAFGSNLYAVDLHERATWHHGLRVPTPEQIQHVEKNWPKIVGVKPNKLGAARLKKHLDVKGRSAIEHPVAESVEDEFITNKHDNVERRLSALRDVPLPAYVDNSSLPSFPLIGDQGQEGSCVAFGTTYYQATHEVGLMNGTNNKTSTTNVLSPKWTYNMVNGGGDNGSYPQDACNLLAQNGAPSIDKLPYQAGDFLAWDLQTQDWVDALSNRTTPPQFVKGLGGDDPQDLTQIKQLLANGHVLTFCTFAEGWVYATVGQDPSPNAANRFVGQTAVSWVNSPTGGHCITIVGYDDDVWIDVNGNGVVDEGEKGAFLIANSWGTGWGSNGFFWVAYDAFLSNSAVVNGPGDGRVAMGAAMDNLAITITAKAHNYSPSLIAQFELDATTRNQIGISGGVSDTNSTVPSTVFTSGALAYQGGPYGFDGASNSSDETATFVLDLSDLVDPSTSGDSRFYLRVTDNQTGDPTTLCSYTLRDLVNNQSVVASNVPLTADNNTVVSYVDYSTGNPDVPDITPPTAEITYPAEGAVVHGLVHVTVSATDNVAVGRVELYLDDNSQPLDVDTTAPYNFCVDVKNLSNGWHLLTAIAYDTSENRAYAYRWIKIESN